MSIRNVIPANEGEACRCGRTNTKIHCPACGSFSIYGFSKRDTVRDRSGQEIQARRFRCQRCNVHFNELEATPTVCEAPLFVYESMKQRRKEDKFQETVGQLFKENRKKALEFLFNAQPKPEQAQRPTEPEPETPSLVREENSTEFKDEFFEKEDKP